MSFTQSASLTNNPKILKNYLNFTETRINLKSTGSIKHRCRWWKGWPKVKMYMCVSLALLIDIWLFIFNGFTKVPKKSPSGHHVTAKKIQSCLKVVAKNRQSGRKELLYPFQPSASPASHFLQSHRSFIARDILASAARSMTFTQYISWPNENEDHMASLQK